ncbi:uncharacterized protein LOC130920593 [Corythoichthys intestinalis]|uniref:uncharacterized protein LOC130920593 n=1 Tax=Corythoichthys intestinalis TaxID=161448 RepID=UPI0025A5A5F3|nr:uncharacterized protein LOC130920593 [Corythoichthys intestinalis]XP_057699902.1 uncharacterized protein LOC130920593 [Corythoichthys intestinalis]XP_057699903.1 uncharacterized protein LOC130920593 [Corythoichthys intestinalis]
MTSSFGQMAKMHGRLLALLLVITVTATTATISQNQLATLMNGILRKLNGQTFKRLPMFSLAVSIPRNEQGTYDLNQVHLDESVRDAILHCNVYSNRNAVAATVLKWPNVLQNCPNALVMWEDVLQKCKEESMTWQDVDRKCRWAMKNHRADHAEYRVLKEFQHWSEDKDKSGLLLLYVYASSCTDQCTGEGDERSILNLVEGIRQWTEYAVVFSKVFEPKESRLAGCNPLSVGEREAALIRLGNHLGQNGLQKIFRCDRVKTNKGNTIMVCDSCSTEGDVTPRCYRNPNQRRNIAKTQGQGLPRQAGQLGVALLTSWAANPAGGVGRLLAESVPVVGGGRLEGEFTQVVSGDGVDDKQRHE